ncbi:MAG: hydrolase [Rhodospirillaceae bacterium]
MFRRPKSSNARGSRRGGLALAALLCCAMAIQLDLLNRPDGRTSILMPSGFVLDLLAPDATGLPITDIAQCLASQPRWGGAVRPWYSVAEHSVMVSRLVPPAQAYSALMHDSEEFLGDWPSPVKVMLDREYVKQRLRPVKDALRRRFGFQDDVSIIKHVDLVCMATELRDLLPPAWMDWGHLPPPHPDKIIPVGPERAYTLFLERYEELKHRAAPFEPPRPLGKRGGTRSGKRQPS